MKTIVQTTRWTAIVSMLLMTLSHVVATDMAFAQASGASNSQVVNQDSEQEQARLLSTVRLSMKAAADRLQSRDLGEDAIESQESAVRALDKLIKMASDQPPAPSQTSQPQQDQGEQDTQQAASQNDSSEPDASPNDNKTVPQNAGRSGESPDRTPPGDSGSAEAGRQAYIEGVWGHLPAGLRERMLNISRERTLPKYEELVRQYYKALADRQKDRQEP